MLSLGAAFAGLVPDIGAIIVDKKRLLNYSLSYGVISTPGGNYNLLEMRKLPSPGELNIMAPFISLSMGSPFKPTDFVSIGF